MCKNSKFCPPNPIVFDDSEILILGTFPGEKSLENKMYYANNKNRFWKVLGVKECENDKPNDYIERIIFLKNHKIALWDVCESVEREGSADNKIKSYITNDIEGFLKAHTSINKILVAGRKAEKMFKKAFPNIEYKWVPSTSSANARTKNIPQKWKTALKK